MDLVFSLVQIRTNEKICVCEFFSSGCCGEKQRVLVLGLYLHNLYLHKNEDKYVNCDFIGSGKPRLVILFLWEIKKILNIILYYDTF